MKDIVRPMLAQVVWHGLGTSMVRVVGQESIAPGVVDHVVVVTVGGDLGQLRRSEREHASFPTVR